jgi:hypothetical protein
LHFHLLCGWYFFVDIRDRFFSPCAQVRRGAQAMTGWNSDNDQNDALKTGMRGVEYWMWGVCVFFILVLVISAAGCAPAPTEEHSQDLFLEAQQARATSDAALQAAEFQERYLTATAQAPIIHITETAAAYQINATSTAQASLYRSQSWTVTAQSIQATETSAMTATALAWTPTPNATMTVVFAQLQADATQIHLQAENATTRAEMQATGWYTLITIVFILAVAFAYVFARRLSMMPHIMDERGRSVPMIDVLDGTAWDIERSANAVMGVKRQFLLQLPKITDARQDAVIERSQMVDAGTRTRQGKRLLNAPNPIASYSGTSFELPEWTVLKDWDGRGIPYYTAGGLEVVDCERFPHLAVLGATGMGKSRRFIRPLIACALAAGQRVVIVGKSADYRVFESHPNVTLVRVNKLTEQEQALRYARILQAIVEEMNRRDDILSAAHQSTWTHSGRERTWVILDELGNALRLMNREASNQCRIWVEGGVMEGRKAGFNFVIANQRATGMSSILSQTGKAIFRVEADEERAHRSLAGASALHDGYFMARFGSLKLAGGFNPTDEEISAFFQSRPVSKIERDEWVEGMEIASPELPVTTSKLVSAMDDRELRVIEMYQSGASQREIEKALYGYNGGAASAKVSSVIRSYRNAATTTLPGSETGMVAA